MKRNIVVLDSKGMNPGDLSWDELKSLGNLEVFANTPYELIVERAKNAEIVVINKCIFDKNIISSLPKLKYICESATGYDNIDIDFAAGKGILVSNVRDYSTKSVVQHVFSLIFALTNKVEYSSNEVKKGRWANNDYFTFWDFPTSEISGKTLGLYGFGKIASEVAKITNAFGMKIIANRKNPGKGYPDYVTHATIDELFKKSDILSLHAPQTSENLGFINKESLQLMKNNAILINTARGKMINEFDLKHALDTGIIKAAGLDVLSSEPPKSDNPLLMCDKCLITPHQAWTSIESRQKLINGVAENIKAYISNSPINLVN